MEPQKGERFNSGLITVTPDEETGKLKVKIPPLRALTKKPSVLLLVTEHALAAVFSLD